jgi:hypothetical protein
MHMKEPKPDSGLLERSTTRIDDSVKTRSKPPIQVIEG